MSIYFRLETKGGNLDIKPSKARASSRKSEATAGKSLFVIEPAEGWRYV